MEWKKGILRIRRDEKVWFTAWKSNTLRLPGSPNRYIETKIEMLQLAT